MIREKKYYCFRKLLIRNLLDEYREDGLRRNKKESKAKSENRLVYNF